MESLSKDLEKYIEAFSSPEDPLLKELDRETNLRVVQPRMISGNVQGQILTFLTRMISPATILEIGTFTGYSTLCFAAGLPEGGVIDTIEVDDELGYLSSSFFSRSPHGPKIRRHTGSALEIAPSLGKVFDLVFIDGDKREYPAYYRMLMGDNATGRPLVRSGSYLIVDNILWYGKVAGPIPHNDLHTRGIYEFNRLVAEDGRVENIIIPVRDGLNLIRIK